MPPSAPEAPTVLAVGAPNARRAAAGPCHGVASATIPTAAGGAAVLPEGVWRTSCGGDREARGHRPQKDSGPRSPSRDSETASRPEAAAQSRKQDTRAAAPRHRPQAGRGRGRPPPTPSSTHPPSPPAPSTGGRSEAPRLRPHRQGHPCSGAMGPGSRFQTDSSHQCAVQPGDTMLPPGARHDWPIHQPLLLRHPSLS